MAVAFSDVRGNIRDPATRRAVSQMDKLDLEDRHFHLMEENLALKKYSRSQEEKMKKMATKLLRLTADNKKEVKLDGLRGEGYTYSPRGALEAELYEERCRSRELGNQNMTLKSKLSLLRQQWESKGKRHTPYDRVQSKVSTGLSKKGKKYASTDDISIKGHAVSSHDAATQSSFASCHNLVDYVRRDNQDLEEQLLHVRQEFLLLKTESEKSREEQRLRGFQLEEEKINLQEELQAQITALQKENTESEMQLLKVKRELKDKATRLETVQIKYSTLERNNDLLKSSHSRVLQEMDILNRQLKEERSRTSQMQSELHDFKVSQRTNSELQEAVDDLRSERDRLRHTNERLMKRQDSVVSSKEEQLRTQINSLQKQINDIETERKNEVKAKAKIIDELSIERGLSETLDKELRALRSTYLQLKEDYDQTRDKLNFFNKESSLDWSEIEKAMVQIQEKREKGIESFPAKHENGEVKGHLEIQELRASHADTISELDKTRKLLQMQHTINKEYKKEVEFIKLQMTEKEQEHVSQTQEYAQLLDIRAARIKRLESQLKDIAYGTRQVKIDTKSFEYESEKSEETVELERGQNLLQFHVSQVTLSSEVTANLGTASPALFVTLNFSNYEIKVTSVKQGVKPYFGFTSSFVVTVDDSFLQHLQKGSISIELNQALGFRYQTIAVATVKCRELVTSSGGKVSGTVALTGVDNLQEFVNVGSVEYWMKLKLPIAQAVRLYQEQKKASSILDDQSLTLHTVTPHTPSHQPLQDPDYNELIITITKCVGISSPDGPPSCYVMYKLYTFPDYDTQIVAPTLSPVFDDIQTYPLAMNRHLDDYLRTESLELYLFDDSGVDDNYIGIATVPLEALAQGHQITDTFQLTNNSGERAGYIEVSIRWRNTYHPRKQPPPPALASLKPHAVTATQVQTLVVPSMATETPKTNSDLPQDTSQHVSHDTVSGTNKKRLKMKTKQQANANAVAQKVSHEASVSKKHGNSSKEQSIGIQHIQNNSQVNGDSQDVVVTTNKMTATPDVDTLGEETSALSECDSVSVASEKRGKISVKSIAIAKKPSKLSVATTSSHLSSQRPARKTRKPALLTQSGKQSKMSHAILTTAADLKTNQTDTHALNNSLPPLRQDNTESPRKREKDSREKVDLELQTSDPRASDIASDNDSEYFDVTDTESVMSSLSGLKTGPKLSGTSHSPEGQLPTLTIVTEFKDNSSSLSSNEESEMGTALPKQDLETVSKNTGAVNSQTVEAGDSIHEDIEEILSESEEEDTMFEDTLHQSGESLSGLSEHSSDEPRMSIQAPTSLQLPQELSRDRQTKDDLSDMTPSEIEEQDGDPITSNTLTTVSESESSVVSTHVGAANTMSITVESFTIETGSVVESNPHIRNIFVEYKFLDFDYGDLETPSSLPKPYPGEAITFNFKKVFQLNPHRMDLLAKMMKPGSPSDGRIIFTVVADPDDQDADCDELGSAEVHLKTILDNGEDLHSESIDVFCLEGDQAKRIGFLNVTVEALDVLQQLSIS